MYSTNINDNRYVIQCILVHDDTCVRQFIVDTGARFTCCYYAVVDLDLHEEKIAAKEAKTLGGFVQGVSVIFYRLHLKQFTIGNIDMGEQDIWVTFDERVTDTVLGMDILQQVIFTANPYDKRIYFYKDREDYHANFTLWTDMQ